MSTPKRTPAEGLKTLHLPPHIAGWHLPPGWSWGRGGLFGDHRHYQQVNDGLGRSLALVTAPNPAHHAWLYSEARRLAHRSHPSIPTTYHYWVAERERKRGPGYLRRWVTGETVRAHMQRLGKVEIPYVMQVVRGAGSTLSYLHDSGTTHGALTIDTVWLTATGRLWLLEWQWAVPREDIPDGMRPRLSVAMTEEHRPAALLPPEWTDNQWKPTPSSDQWQLAAICFTALTGEDPPAENVPPVGLLRPETPSTLATAIDRALSPDPAERFPSVAAFLRVADAAYFTRGGVVPMADPENFSADQSEEARIRYALGDDYEVLSAIGAGSFGNVWRVRDLTLEREVALKVLHPHVAEDARAVAAFWTEAKLAAQLAHPAIVPIYDWDSKGDLSWYTMELADEGSVASLVERSGARTLEEISAQIDSLLDGLAAAHAIGIVHRDLKPENILIDRYGRWRMTDFGIANATGEDVTGTTGTPAFAAPEQLLGEPQGASVDLYALAAIVVFALCGQPPFGDGDAATILSRQLAGAPDLTRFAPPLAEWIGKALMQSPADRFVDAAEMKEAWRSTVKRMRRRERAAWWRRNAVTRS
ncbi:MAG TPA: serine/threonine-protein kinase [Gemmatimonadaceae bacterium]|nr:serine/threonine-protein kinase [Gemmatimonadaceae bacterium]